MTTSAPKKIAVALEPIHFTRQFEIMTGIIEYARAKGTLTLGARPQTSLHFQYSQLEKWTGDGVIGMFYFRSDVDALLARGIVVVNLTEQLLPMQLPVVVSDNWQIGRLAAAHLVERGYRQFGFIGESQGHFSNQRHEGFLNELKRLGISKSAVWTAYLPDRDSLSPGWFAQQNVHPENPVGILAYDDDVGFSTIAAAQANGFRVPQDVAVVGVNDLELICYSASVSLTSVSPAYLKIGLEAAKLLDNILNGKAPANTVIRVPPAGLVERMSTLFLAFEDPLVEKALAFMHSNISKPFNVMDVVRSCGKSRRTLESRFVKAVGRSLLDEINRLRVERAKRLLCDTDWTVGRIAEECGFGDTKLMVRVFHRLVGTTPTIHRRDAAGESR